MPISTFDWFKGGRRDEDGYLILHESALCPRCRKPTALHAVKDVDKKRRMQILGYCQKCFFAIMGW